tara:strand:+ start:129068 stop:131749 length:2682 start_codon:yes stop_codon:yes gene_type:complete
MFALGLGELTLDSNLYQPLNASIAVVGNTNEEASQVTAQLAPVEDFDRLNVDRIHFLANIKFHVETNTDGQLYVQLNTTERVQQPSLDILVLLKWSGGQVLRQYTLLFDPADYESDDGAFITPTSTTKPVQTTQASAASSTVSSVTMPAAPSATAIETNTIPKAKYTGAEYGPTVVTDTLWDIAREVRPVASMNVIQTMIALERLNPQAFQWGNINALMSGYMLRIPTAEQIQSVDMKKAEADIAQQNREWRMRKAGQNVPSHAPIATLNSVSPSAPTQILSKKTLSTTISPATSTSISAVKLAQPTNAEQNVLKTQTQTDIVKRLQAEVAITAQTLNTAKEANQVLKLKMQDLEQRNQNLAKLLSETKQEITTLKKVLSGKLPASAMTKPVKTTTKQKAIKSPAVSSAVWLEGNMWLWLAIAAILLLVVAYVVYKLKQRRETRQALAELDAEPITAEQADTKFVETAEDKIEEDVTEEPLESTEQVSKASDIVETVVAEPVAKPQPVAKPAEKAKDYSADANEALKEADTYVNYGRLALAENVLKQALQHHADNIHLWEKLLEIYAEADNRADFEACCQEVPEELMLTGSKLALKVIVVRKSTWGDSDFKAKPKAAKMSSTPAPAEQAAPEIAFTPEVTAVSDDDPLLASDDVPAAVVAETPAAPEVKTSVLEDNDIEFEMGLADDLTLDGDVAPTQLDTQLPQATDTEAETDELIGEEAEPVAEIESAIVAEPVEVAESELTHYQDEDILVEEFEMPAVVESDVVESELEDSLDTAINTDMGDIDLDAISFEPETLDSADDAEDEDSNSSAFELSLDDDNGLKLDMDSDEEDLAMPELEGEDSVATKLDLARAYIDMGDTDAAKSILQNVIEQGDDTEKQEAQKLLAEISS